MAISVACPNCNHAYSVDEKLLGQRVKCKNCGSVFTIEEPPPGPLTDIDPFASADFDAALDEKPVSKAAKLYNPVEIISSAKAAKPQATATSKAAENPPVFLASSGGYGTSSTSATGIYLILALFIAFSLGLGMYWTVQAFMDVKDSGLATTTVVHIWEWIALFDVLIFLVMGPLMWLGVWSTSKILNFRLTDSPYLRGCAVAGIAATIAALAELSPDLLKVTLLVLLLPAIYYVLKIGFGLDWTQSGVAVAFGTGALFLGGFISYLLLGMVMSGSIFAAVDSARQLALTNSKSNPQLTASTDSASNNTASPLPASQDPAVYERFEDLVHEKMTADISQSAREEHLPEVLDLKRQLASLKAAFHDRPDWQDLVQSIDAFEQKVMSLPSAKSGDEIYTDSLDGDDWSTGSLSRGRLSPEVSFRQFKFQPPIEMKLDLKSSAESPEGLIWTGTKYADARLSIQSIPRKNPRQLRPALDDNPAVPHRAEALGLLTVNGTNVTLASGQINGMTATRLTAKDGSHVVQYYIPAGAQWLVINVMLPGDVKFAKVMDAAARTLREIDTGEAAADPFRADQIAPRLVDDYEHASAILSKEGDAGEDAVAKLLLSEDRAVRQQALTYLKDHATERSALALRHVASDPDAPLADSAKAALSRIGTVVETDPTSAPSSQPAVIAAGLNDSNKDAEIAGILAELHSNEVAVRKEGIQNLLLITPVQSQRRAVCTKLVAMLRTHDQSASSDDYTRALIAWGEPGIGPEMLPLLKEGIDPETRHAAMKICSALKASGTATAIAKWLKGDPAPAANALVDFGPDAEPAVDACMRDADPGVRIEAARLLSQIGTRKSLLDLNRAAHDTRDAGAQEAAKTALDAVKARASNETEQPSDTVK